MKQALTTLLIIATIGLMLTGMISCRKNSESPDIKTYDQQQITAYLQTNNLTGYSRDLSGGDTTGIYYKIIKNGTGASIDYSDDVFFVYTITSLDGKYVQSDSIINHAYNYVGHLTPPGLILAMKNIIKNRGTQAHVIIPSRLAYGINGSGTGSTRLGGNESLDYYINVVDPANQAAYDDMLIKNYMANNSLTGFTKTASGLYYKVTQAGTGTNGVTPNSTIGVQFTGKFMNNTVFDQFVTADSTSSVRDYGSMPKGWQEGLKNVTKGSKISLIMPSSLGYGLLVSNPYSFSINSGTTAPTTPPPNSCLYYNFNIYSITN